MSLRYKGAVISATPPTTTGGNSGTAPGAWTLQQQLQAQAAGNWPNQPVWYVEDVFSTWLYTGNSSTQTITNGIDLSTYGGLVWTKYRSGGNISTARHGWFDTARGVQKQLSSNLTTAEVTGTDLLSAFNNNGFSLGADATYGSVNRANALYGSWTFRKQTNFFQCGVDTNNPGMGGRAITHGLGSTPGCVIVKRTDAPEDWYVWHRSLPNGDDNLILNSTAAVQTNFGVIYNVNSTTFTLNGATGGNYVWYVFAHNAGGFGLTGTDNVISCGSYTEPSSGYTDINLGYEVQWLLTKSSGIVGDWVLTDVMQGMSYSSISYLRPNTSGATQSFSGSYLVPTATGFRAYSGFYGGGTDIIYIAIRRGPMKTPTSGTSVYQGIARTGTGANATITTGFVTDLAIGTKRSVAGSSYKATVDRLRGTSPVLFTNTTDAESASTDMLTGFDSNTGYKVGADTTYGYFNESSASLVSWNFRRAPGFFDEVCYTGDGSASRAITHNLGVAPEFIIVKTRSVVGNWRVATAFTSTNYLRSVLNLNGATNTVSYSGDNTFPAQPTSTTFTVGNFSGVNGSGNTYVSYLFATCPGVSKVGTYTGTGAAQTINCGFTSGARFVLIKGPDDGNDNWYVYDSARGITSGNDPYLFMNTTDAEVTGTNYVDADATGFKITSSAPASLNTNGSVYIFIAIA